MKKALLIIVIALAVGILFFRNEPTPQPNTVTQLQDSELCFSRIAPATKTAPYSVEEYIKLSIDKNNGVTGIKFGFQSGPDMTNGYTGTLAGMKKANGEIVVDYAFTVEGSSNTEQEIYRMTGSMIEKFRYPLKEANKKLVPDTTKEVTLQKYQLMSCEDLNEKM